MLNKENIEKCWYILGKKGITKQHLKAIEEMSELQQALTKEILYPENKEYEKKVQEETVDVIIMLVQLYLSKNYSEELINELAEVKLDRTIAKIEAGEE